MWCNGPNVTALPCQVNGNLCPLKNASNAANYTQDMYETCLRQNNVGFWAGCCKGICKGFASYKICLRCSLLQLWPGQL